MRPITILYDLSTLDNKAGYKQGAEILCSHQQAGGRGLDDGYHGEHPALNTVLAVLFLNSMPTPPRTCRAACWSTRRR